MERGLNADSPLSKVRIASVPYLNAAPLVHRLENVRSTVPSRLATWLDSGECDLAVLSIGPVPAIMAVMAGPAVINIVEKMF